MSTPVTYNDEKNLDVALEMPSSSRYSQPPAASSTSAARPAAYPTSGPALDRRSCCRRFWTAPLSARNWAVAVLFNMIVTFAFGLFSFCWVATTFTTSTAFLIFFPIGPILFMLFLVTWRWMGRVELRLQKYPGEGGYEYTSLPLFAKITGGAEKEDLFSCAGFWTAFKILVLDGETWKNVVYFLLVKLPVSIFLFVYSLVTVVASLAFIFNFISVAAGTKHGHWNQWAWAEWIVASYEGSLVTVPVGYMLLCAALLSSRALARASARLALAILGYDDPNVASQSQPFVSHGAGANLA